MPCEIIDLLSSPISHRGPSVEPAPPRQTEQELPLASDDDLVDLTGVAASHCPQRRSVSPEPRMPLDGGRGKVSARTDFTCFPSDDFDSAIGGHGGGNDNDDSGSRTCKRLRLSPVSDFPSPQIHSRTVPPDVLSQDSVDDLPAMGNIRTTRLLPVAPKRLNYSIANLDPIELSSSPLPGTRPPKKASSILDSDLFASSSPGAREFGGRGDTGAAKSARDPLVNNGGHSRQPSKPSAAWWDPISSSAPQPGLDSHTGNASPRPLQRSVSEVINLDTSDQEDGSPRSSSDEFPDVAKVRTSRWQEVGSKPTTTTTVVEVTAAARKRAPPAPKKSSEERAREKEARARLKEAREAEREQKKREREEARQQRAREKEAAAALAEVNKVRTDKKVSTPEMIVHLPPDLAPATRLQAETLLEDLGVEHRPPSDGSPAGVLTWSRKVRARYDEELERWEPVPMRIEPERHVMAILTAAEFVTLALGGAGADMEAHVGRVRRRFPDHTLIYLIEGLTSWMRKNRSVRNRQFVSAVRSGLAEQEGAPNGSASNSSNNASSQQGRGAATTSRRKKAADSYVDEEAVEEALLGLQMAGTLVQHTGAALETAQQIAVLTQHVSTAPYRRRREAEAGAWSAGFCMEAGQVRAGDGAGDTFVRLLQEVARVTAPVAHGVAAHFDSVPALVRGLERDGPLALEDARRCANRDGAFSDRRVGPALSRRLHKVFTGTDERSTDI